jgi:hypothetical protein
MRNTTKLVLIALAWVSMGAAQVSWYPYYWSWVAPQNTYPGVYSYTSSNNAHTVLNNGADVYAAETYYSLGIPQGVICHSGDQGQSWHSYFYFQITCDSSKNPAMAFLDGGSERLFSINLDKWYTDNSKVRTKAGDCYFTPPSGVPGGTYGDLGDASDSSGTPSVSETLN